jgi:soluble lytic murein transglycosylase-like protein
MKRRTVFFFCLIVLSGSLHPSPTRITEKEFAAVMRIGRALDVPPSVTAALMLEESSGCPDARGPVVKGYRALGLFQIYTKPDNLADLLDHEWVRRGRRLVDFDILNPEHNAIVALGYLSRLHSRFRSWEVALIYFNNGDVKNAPLETVLYAKRIVANMFCGYPWTRRKNYVR